MTAAWDHDWRRFVKEQLKAKGFASLTAYVRNNEGVPFEELAADLGGKQVAQVIFTSKLILLPSNSAKTNPLHF